MYDFDNGIDDELKRVIQAERREKQKAIKSRNQQEKINVRRYIFVGEVICRNFPHIYNFKVHRTFKENYEEFLSFTDIVEFLAENEDYINDIKEHLYAPDEE